MPYPRNRRRIIWLAVDKLTTLFATRDSMELLVTFCLGTMTERYDTLVTAVCYAFIGNGLKSLMGTLQTATQLSTFPYPKRD